MERHFSLSISPDKLNDLIQLAETKDLAKIIDNAVTIYYTALLKMTRGYRLGLIPVTSDGGIDQTKSPILIKI